MRLTIDGDWRITGLTNEAAAWFGAGAPAQLTGVDARKLLPIGSPAYVAIESCLATGKPASARFGSDFRPGHVVEARFDPNGDGVRVRFRATGESPTRRKASPAAAPRKLRSRKNDFRFTLDRDWRITTITEGAAAWCGSTADDLVGRDARVVWPPMTPPIAAAAEAAFSKGATTTLEQPSLHAPGRWVRLEIGPYRTGIRFRFEDITSALAAPGRRIANLSLGPAEIVLLDHRGVIVAANAAWRASFATFGLGIPNAGVGASYADVCKAVVPNLEVDRLRSRLDDIFRGRTPYFQDTYSPETGDEVRQVQIAPLRLADTTYFAAIHEDLTENARTMAKLNSASDQLLRAQEEERQRIAIELHDSMSQHLAGLVLTIAQLRRRAAPEPVTRTLIDQMAELTQAAIRETRVLSYLLNASDDERGGLEAAVRRFVEGFGRRTGLEAAFTAAGPVDAVSAAVQHAVFRVVQEALSNVHQHARADRVSVKLVARGDALTVRVKDNGRGIGSEAGVGEGEPRLGVGIPGMRARIAQLGGQLEIDGGGRGTVVTASVPLQAQAALAS